MVTSENLSIEMVATPDATETLPVGNNTINLQDHMENGTVEASGTSETASEPFEVIDFKSFRTPTTSVAREIASQARTINGPIGKKELQAKAETGRIFTVNPYDLHIKPDQNSRDEASPLYQQGILDLVNFIVTTNHVPGDLVIWLEDGKFFVSEGHRRLQAIWYANSNLLADDKLIVGVSCKFGRPGDGDLERLDHQMELNSGVPLNPYEQGILAKKYLSRGLSVADVAKRWNRSSTHVNYCLTLHEAPALVLDLVRSGAITTHTAMSTMKASKKAGDNKAVEALTKAVEKNKKDGKKKTSGKHVKAAMGFPKSTKAIDYKKEFITAFRDCEVTPLKETDEVMIKINAHEWKNFYKLLPYNG